MNLKPVLAVAAGIPQRILTLSFVDLLIIVIYFGVVLAIGFYLKKYARTGEDFFMSGMAGNVSAFATVWPRTWRSICSAPFGPF